MKSVNNCLASRLNILSNLFFKTFYEGDKPVKCIKFYKEFKNYFTDDVQVKFVSCDSQSILTVPEIHTKSVFGHLTPLLELFNISGLTQRNFQTLNNFPNSLTFLDTKKPSEKSFIHQQIPNNSVSNYSGAHYSSDIKLFLKTSMCGNKLEFLQSTDQPDLKFKTNPTRGVKEKSQYKTNSFLKVSKVNIKSAYGQQTLPLNLFNIMYVTQRSFHTIGQIQYILEHKNLKNPAFVCFNTKSNLKGMFFSKQVIYLKEKVIPKEKIEESWGGPEAYKLILFIQDNFDETINKNPSILVFFSAEWCHHCRRLRKTYGKAAVMAKEANLLIVFGTFDIDTNPDIADEKGVVGIPILKYYKNGKFISNYKGKRTVEDLFEFAKNPPSKSVSSPDSKKADI